jgi:hypothetical protein
MRTTLSLLAASLAFVAGSASALPQTPTQYVSHEIDQGRIGSVTLETIDILVKESVDELIAAGHIDEAYDIQVGWNQTSASMDRFALQPFDLGDHAALNDYLTQMYNQMEAVMGDTVLKSTRLYDIKIINYAIPVVFDPRMESGKWSHPEPKVEYSKHFVPFASMMTYWIARVGCQVSGAPKQVCGPVAGVSEHLMKTRLGGQLSDQVYDRANQ